MFSFTRSKKQRTAVRPSRRPSYRPSLEVLEDRCLLSAGTLDTTFNPAGNPPGTATVAVGTNNVNWGTDVLIQPSGKIVVTGYSGTETGPGYQPYFSTAEFDSNGSLDPNFGSGGTAITSSQGSNTPSFSYAATLYPTGSTGDEKILEVGTGLIGRSNGIALVRFNPDGSLDTSFGKQGMVFTSLRQGSSGATGVVLQPNGTSLPKIVAVASYHGSNIELVRYNPDGSLDKTFGSNGVVSTQLTSSSNTGFFQLALDPVTGDLIVAGSVQVNSTTNEGFLAAYTPNGAPDTSFGGTGIVYNSSFPAGAVPIEAETIQSNGYIVTAGSGPGATFDISRYSPSGALDSTFGNGGVVTTPIPGSYNSAYVWALALQSNGDIVAGGEVDSTTTKLFALARYNANGSLDTTFGTSGIVTTQIGGSSFNQIRGLALQSNGDIVAEGPSQTSKGLVFAVARYLPSEPQIGSFTANPNPVTAGSNTTLTASNITDGNPNSTITQVTLYYYDINGNKVVLGTGTSDGSGNWILTFTVNLTSGNYTLYAQAQDNYGVVGDPTALTLTVQ